MQPSSWGSGRPTPRPWDGTGSPVGASAPKSVASAVAPHRLTCRSTYLRTHIYDNDCGASNSCLQACKQQSLSLGFVTYDSLYFNT
jgi:hypothetical protein